MKLKEKPDTVHGRLLESVHISGYSFQRACNELEWLLADDRWKQVGVGFEDINEFLATLDFSEFKIIATKRKKLAKRLEEIEASQRATARMLGVDHKTIGRDLTNSGENSPVLDSESNENQSLLGRSGENSPPDVLATKFTGNEEWFTPPEYIKSVRKVLGRIDLDPASNDIAQKTIKAKTYYTINNDGLTKEWNGKIWLNPPYTALVINKFIDKLNHRK